MCIIEKLEIGLHEAIDVCVAVTESDSCFSW